MERIEGQNAFRFRFDPQALAPLQDFYQQELAPWLAGQSALFEGGKTFRQATGSAHFYLFSYDDYPLLWFSNHSAEAYALFRDFYEALALPHLLGPHVKHKRELVLYSGFLVLGRQAPHKLWHDDYRAGAQAYTLITPLFELAPEHGHLLYQRQTPSSQNAQGSEEALYTYRLGEAIVLGDGFLHCTEPYALSAQNRVLLSLTCGSDQLEHWPVIRQAVANQSYYFKQPCGHLSGSCRCFLWHRVRSFFKL